MKPEFEKYNKNTKQDFSSFYNNGKDLIIIIISCNHKVHSECYNKLLLNTLVYSNEKKYASYLINFYWNKFLLYNKTIIKFTIIFNKINKNINNLI